jgi:hypothetical protein
MARAFFYCRNAAVKILKLSLEKHTVSERKLLESWLLLHLLRESRVKLSFLPFLFDLQCRLQQWQMLQVNFELQQVYLELTISCVLKPCSKRELRQVISLL